MSENPFNQTDQDRAMADRLARLGTMPVDTGRVDRWIESRIARPRRVWTRWLGPMRMTAAILLVVGLVGWFGWGSSNGPVMASTAEMAAFHHEMISGRVPVTQVDSMAQASQLLAGRWPDLPELPQSSQGHVMACCMSQIKDRKVIGVLFRTDGQLVTMSIARASDLRPAHGSTMTRDGATYQVQTLEDLNMVSTQRDGRWVCLMGAVSVDRLIDLAEALTFN